MTPDQPNISIKVDVANPGQFFACCGLLELADRLWPSGEVLGRFIPRRFDRSSFHISAKLAFSTRDVIHGLLRSTRRPVDPYQIIMGSNGKPVTDPLKIAPVEFAEPTRLRISWWLDEVAGQQSDFKTWSAHKTSHGLLDELAAAVSISDVTDESLLQLRVGMTSRLGLDARSSWNTLDTGFSPNDQNLPVDTYAATELLAAIGLETFRPATDGEGFRYASWSLPLPVGVARAVASGCSGEFVDTRFRFHIRARGKFKSFTQASPLLGETR